MKVFFCVFFQIALASAVHCQVISKVAIPISGSSKSESPSCPKPNQYKNMIRYDKRGYIEFDLTNEMKVIDGKDTVDIEFKKQVTVGLKKFPVAERKCFQSHLLSGNVKVIHQEFTI